MTFVGSGTGATIIGIPTVAGTYAFQVIATNPVNGSYSIRTFTIVALEVSTTSLPTFTIGTPYSEQLLASGGSGNYNWRVATGTLPDGLILSLTGLISGTPTSGAGGDLTFEVIDITCEAASQQFIPPRVAMTTASTTRISTVRGYDEFVQSSPPKRYKRVDYAGAGMIIYRTVEDVFHTGFFIFSKYAEFSGYGEIDIDGNFLSKHRKDVQYRFGGLGAPWTPAGNQALNTSGDRTGFFFEFIYNHVPSSVHRYSLTPDEGDFEVPNPNYPVGSPLIGKLPVTDSEHVAEKVEFTLTDPGPAIWAAIPNVEINGILNKWVNTYETYDYTVDVSNEYTEADAISVATYYSGSLRVASNLPRTLGYTSRLTSVVYSLNFTNLVVGSSYVASVTLVNTSGASVQVPYAFTASATTHTIVGLIPTPSAGHSIEVRLPTVAYAP